MLKKDKKITDDTKIKRIVRERYSSVALGKGGCCGPKICCDSGNDAGGPDLGLNMIGDAYQAVDGYLPEADLGLGCGLPTQHAGIKEGDAVLDLGSGAGIDAFVAGEIEHLPIETATVDVVVSNCVLNLVPDKARAFAEIFRVLRPGAHFCVSGIVATGELSEPIRQAAALYAGCIAGALPRGHYLRVIKEAGFENAEVAETKPIELPDSVLERHIDKSQIAVFRASGISLQSITVRARKPAQ